MGIASARGATQQTLSAVMRAVTSHSAKMVRSLHFSANPKDLLTNLELVCFLQ